MDNGIVGWGETIVHATHATVPDDIEKRIVGEEAAGLLWNDSLGSGVQMALFDAIAKNENVPVHSLLGSKVRDWCPISWWACDMEQEEWERECKDAIAQGYMSAKFKTRPWQDLHACLDAVTRVVPTEFKLDLDFNGHLVNSANAIPLLKSIEKFEQLAMIESPIPQEDVEGNLQLRKRLNRPLAMHFDRPPIMTALREDVMDGLIISGGASQLTEQGVLAKAANKPFWLQLVGTGITTTWAAHIGSVCKEARWPAITCMNIWESQLLKRPIEVHAGYYRVPDGPGLGIEIDEKALRKYAVNYSHVDTVRHIYRYTRAGGESVFIIGNRSTFHGRYTQTGLPICEKGSSIAVIPDDGSRKFEAFYKKLEREGIIFESR
jgi:L-alanine-DL-glutamate epimerase-like enolase superfamily enzyme